MPEQDEDIELALAALRPRPPSDATVRAVAEKQKRMVTVRPAVVPRFPFESFYLGAVAGSAARNQ